MSLTMIVPEEWLKNDDLLDYSNGLALGVYSFSSIHSFLVSLSCLSGTGLNMFRSMIVFSPLRPLVVRLFLPSFQSTACRATSWDIFDFASNTAHLPSWLFLLLRLQCCLNLAGCMEREGNHEHQTLLFFLVSLY